MRGRLFESGAAAHRPATLTRQADGSLLLDDGGTRRVLAPSALRWSSRITDTARRATLPGGAVFETFDNDRVDALSRRGPGLLHRLERLGTLQLTLTAALALVAVLIGLRWAVPWLGDAASRFVPRAAEARIGAALLDTLDRLSFQHSDLPVATRQAIEAEFNDLAVHASAPPGSLGLIFRRGGQLVGANALALPGGQVVVTDELVALAPRPADLAGVLAHEISHVEYRHGMRRLGRLAGLSVVLMLITGDGVGAVYDLGTLGAGLLDLGYSRGFEREADARGAALMRRAGKNPDTLALMLERLSAASGEGLPGWLSSHPPTQERVDAIRARR